MTALAQDLIEKKDGSVITAKVIKVEKTRVRYKPWASRNGKKVSFINISEIAEINYQNGKIVSYGGGVPKYTGPKETIAQAADDNAGKISAYSREYTFSSRLKASKKPARMGMALFSVTQGSVLSSADVEVTIETETNAGRTYEKGYPLNWYRILIRNKTDHVIYVDKQQCLRTPSIGRRHCYYTGNAKVDDSHELQRIIEIAPSATAQLSVNDYIEGKGWAENAEDYCFGCVPYFSMDDYNDNAENAPNISKVSDEFRLPYGTLNVGEVRKYGEEDTPLSVAYDIVYSSSKDFMSYTMLSLKTYLSQVIGIENRAEPYNGMILVQTTKWMSGDKNNYPSRLIEGYTEKTIVAPVGFSDKN